MPPFSLLMLSEREFADHKSSAPSLNAVLVRARLSAARRAGGCLNSATGQVLVMVLVAIGMCFTWPTLEAILCEGETTKGLQHSVGLFNVIWAGMAALADFTGGAMLEGIGARSLFYVPAAILLGELLLALW